MIQKFNLFFSNYLFKKNYLVVLKAKYNKKSYNFKTLMIVLIELK